MNKKLRDLTWTKWGKIFQEPTVFTPLIEKIFIEEQRWPVKTVTPLTPGTNAVFLVNDVVLKIFAPRPICPWPQDDYEVELAALKAAEDAGLPTAHLLANGAIEDSYTWRYFLLEAIVGQDFGRVRHQLSADDLKKVAVSLRSSLKPFHKAIKKESAYQELVDQVRASHRWAFASNALKEEILTYVEERRTDELYQVHGDLTSENVMVDDRLRPYIIDFADAKIAPVAYEYPPLIFDLFAGSELMIASFFEHIDEQVAEDLLWGLLLHDFGGDITKLIWSQYEQKSLDQLTCVEDLRALCRRVLQIAPK